MTYQLSWRIEKRVIHLCFPERVTVGEAQDAGDKLREYFQTGADTVHFMVDMRKIRISPIGVQTNLNLANALVQPNLGWVVTVGGTPLTMMMMEILAQIKRFKLHQTDTEASAMAFLQEKDDSLNALI